LRPGNTVFKEQLKLVNGFERYRRVWTMDTYVKEKKYIRINCPLYCSIDGSAEMCFYVMARKVSLPAAMRAHAVVLVYFEVRRPIFKACAITKQGRQMPPFSF
jgi:hypothetical protein